ncbi:MAG TPA: TlpA disulfide reductase family protein [Pyrinomonadaceae bacterium]|nr:TlpA disulfide reductase family protein [Pyrinomonadaceae bacterium]
MTKLLVLVALIFALAPLSIIRAQGGHEYAPLQEKKIDYKDWTYNSLKDDAPVNLRSLATEKGKKLLLVVYFAPWCPNWHFEAPVAAKLYDKYKSHGLDVIGVSEYGTRDDVRAFFGPSGPPYTVVTESESRNERDKTAHYAYRQAAGDTRRWGSPFNVFLDPQNLNPKGEVLAETIWVVNGELIESDVEKFVRERLGLEDGEEKDGKKRPD